MPRVIIQSAYGMNYTIDTLDEDRLSDWFDEWLPIVWPIGAPEDQAPRVHVQALWLEGDPSHSTPDWLTDTAVTGRLYPLAAHTGSRALELLRELHVRLAKEVVTR